MKNSSWLKINWKWFVPVSVVCISIILFFSTGINKSISDITKAYSETKLYNNALEKVKENQAVTAILGDIQVIDKLAILEGSVQYSEDKTSVKSTVRIIGTKGKARLDISAIKLNNTWSYKSIQVRIKQPKDQQQTFKVLSEN